LPSSEPAAAVTGPAFIAAAAAPAPTDAERAATSTLSPAPTGQAGSLSLSPPPRPAVVRPLAPARYTIQVTVGEDTYAKLRRAQDLLRHVIPNGDPAVILERALTALLKVLSRARLAETARPRPSCGTKPGSRHIPAPVRREVWARDGGRCAFVGAEGRCAETGFLQFHHVVPYAAGGAASVENIQLRCAAHNRWEGERAFGGAM
jgi:hypothetical protein